MQEAQQLLQSTQGWPAGLTVGLMASMQRTGAPHQQSVHLQRRMFEYLMQEVLEQLPPQFQTFLLRSSVLPAWTARQCREVSGDAHAAHWLDELDRRDLFVTVVSGEELTLRAHDLFREFLQWQLARDHAEELPELLMRAAQGEPDHAVRIGYLLRAGDSEQALQDLMRVGNSMIHSGAEQVLQLIDRFPPEREAWPELAFLQGLCAWQRWAWDLMARCMHQAMAGFERQGRAQLAIQARALAVVALYASEPTEARRLWQAAPAVAMDDTAAAAWALAEFMLSTLYGPAASSGPHLKRLVDLVGARPQSLHWLCFLYMHVYIGRWGLRAPAEALVDAVSNAADKAYPQVKPTALLWRSALLLWRGDIAAARELREQVAEEARWLGEPRTVVLPMMIMTAMDRHLSGDDAGAQAVLQQIADDAARTRRTQLVYLQMAGAFATAAGKLAGRARPTASGRAHRRAAVAYLEVCTAALRAELALHRGNASDARALLQPRLEGGSRRRLVRHTPPRAPGAGACRAAPGRRSSGVDGDGALAERTARVRRDPGTAVVRPYSADRARTGLLAVVRSLCPDRAAAGSGRRCAAMARRPRSTGPRGATRQRPE
jgi:LuxR family maltose regulon positive regulatory protein